MLKKYLQKLGEKQDLTQEEAGELIELMSTGEVPAAQISELLIFLKEKGETVEEITGFAQKMREKAVKIDTAGMENITDSCGTGGDKSNTFNISTACAILAASAGVNIAKHSNFGFTSKSGSSNVIQTLGIKLSQTAEEAQKSLKENNIAFIHAPYFHKCTAHVNAVRKKLGIRTVFNLLGPLTNPAFPTGQVIGVPDKELCPKIARVLKNLGCQRAVVVSAIEPIMDEISICGKTFASQLKDDIIENFEIHPEDFGLKRANIQDIQGDTPEVNAGIIRDIFNGKIADARLDIVLLNTAAVLWAGRKADSIEEGLQVAKAAINSGKAAKKLDKLRTGLTQ